MSYFSVAGIQMKVSAAYSNLEMMKFKIDVLMSIYPWVDMIIFSELCIRGPLTHYATTSLEKFEAEFAKMAKKHRIWLLPGSMFEKRDDKVYNTASIINPDGEIVKRYSKMFPFLPYEVGVSEGNEFCVFDVPEVGRFGVSICYDMWFPETSRTLAMMGAEVILHPTLTGTIDRDIELSIIRATAACNQCYVFDINGLDSGGSGRSLICGPDGRVIYQAENTEEMIPIELNLDLVKRSRERGVLRLGQPLKSFRDRIKTGIFDQTYNKEGDFSYLDSLGPLLKPTRTRIEEITRLNLDEKNKLPTSSKDQPL
jgi:predicted amidohydrolase